jgi:hypothetical protein
MEKAKRPTLLLEKEIQFISGMTRTMGQFKSQSRMAEN